MTQTGATTSINDDYRTYTTADFAEAFGSTVADLQTRCRQSLADKDWTYCPLRGAERDAVILKVLRRLSEDHQVIGAPERQQVWENGWREQYEEFRQADGSLAHLLPRFVRSTGVVRLRQEFVRTRALDFERQYVDVLRDWLFHEYFTTADTIYEFGCGTGLNLVRLASLFPQKQLVGSDFVPAARDLVNEIARCHRLRLEGRLFDMIKPDESFDVRPGSSVFTSGSIEQLASQFEAFLQFLLRKRPALCVHIEPVLEFYDSENLVDHLAIQFHRKRGYTHGLLPRLQEMQAAGEIEIINSRRLFFGSLMMEGYNLIVWRPLP